MAPALAAGEVHMMRRISLIAATTGVFVGIAISVAGADDSSPSRDTVAASRSGLREYIRKLFAGAEFSR